MIGKRTGCFLAVFSVGVLCAAEVERADQVSEMVFTAFDTETTGLTAEDGIVEIGAVRFRGDGMILCSTNWLVNPQRAIPFYATDVHGITDDMVATAPVFAAVWPQFEAFCGNTILLAHNARFDIRFLQVELERAGIEGPEFSVLDTLPLYRKWFPCAESHSLDSLSAVLDVSGCIHHRANVDTLLLIRIFAVGMESRDGLRLEGLIQNAGGFKRLGGR